MPDIDDDGVTAAGGYHPQAPALYLGDPRTRPAAAKDDPSVAFLGEVRESADAQRGRSFPTGRCPSSSRQAPPRRSQ
jgi:hypothetical protein